jgi:hypothetical protein
MTSALDRCHKYGDKFLSHILRVTDDGTWVLFLKVETKEQSKQGVYTHSPNKPKKFKKHYLPATKLMATVFWDRRGVLMVAFMQQGATMSQVYCETLKKMRRAGQSEQTAWNADKRCSAPP